MSQQNLYRPHLVILGSTASGKSFLGMALARFFGDAEIVSIDSMQVYKKMDIGTAKPTIIDQQEIPHHMIDLVEPFCDYSLSQFKSQALQVIQDIQKRGKRAILVGGTALYLRAIIDDLQIPGQWVSIRQELEQSALSEDGMNELYKQLQSLDPLAASRILPQNKRRLVRALEVIKGSGKPFSSYGPGLDTYCDNPKFNLIGLNWEPEILSIRIQNRLFAQIEAGFIEEVQRVARIGISRTARQALGYKEFIDYNQGRITLQEATDQILRRTRHFVKRQRAWFKRDPRINWIELSQEQDLETVSKSLGSSLV